MNIQQFYPTIVISDVHLGTEHSKTRELADFLRTVNCNTLILNGDIIDGWHFQKPVLMVPTHIEQECNVIDAMRSGAGVTDDRFNLHTLLDYIPQYAKTLEFRHWVHTSDSIFLYELTHIESRCSNIFSIL